MEPLARGGWQTRDPFLFCVHHKDRYPAGNAVLGPEAPLDGRRLGNDFSSQDGWRMYHGRTVPGFPRHPHRGFETVTVTRQGVVDHADSLGAVARYGEGDLQWLTAGDGIQHAEMFPLLAANHPNILDFFQIWLNLPSHRKRVAPEFTMSWAPDIPVRRVEDPDGRGALVTVSAGALNDAVAPSPPAASWGAEPEAHLAIWQIGLEPRARFELPAVSTGVERSLYFFSGEALRVGGQLVGRSHFVALRGGDPVELQADEAGGEVLLLQGRPIAEPVARRGPFVMNTEAEIRQAFDDYRCTGFGGWPWDGPEPVQARTSGRFARLADGTVERPG